MDSFCSKVFSFMQKKQPVQKKAPTIKRDPNLYVILPYFNYCEYGRRKQLFLEFIERIRNLAPIRIIVVEAALSGTKFQLPKAIPGVYKHIGFVTEHRLWIKENLINLAVKQIPDSWYYMAWIDADITFLNKNWISDTIKTLEHKDIVQMFHTAMHMGPDDEALKIERGFGYMHQTSNQPYHKDAKYGFWHPGFCWAITRPAFDKMGGLIDWAIMGSGDRHTALALIGKVEYSHPGNISKDYAQKLQELQARCQGLTLGFVKGTIIHHWHGRIEDRKYQERWNILTKGEYKPSSDVVHNKNGVLQLSQEGERLHPEFCAYFAGRKEDCTTL